MMGHTVGWLLLISVAGYWVLERASYQKKQDLRRIGKGLGCLIIVISIAGVTCNIVCAIKCSRVSCAMPGHMMKKSGSCPFASPSDNSTQSLPQ